MYIWPNPTQNFDQNKCNYQKKPNPTHLTPKMYIHDQSKYTWTATYAQHHISLN